MKRFTFMINKLQRNTLEMLVCTFPEIGNCFTSIVSEQTIQYYVTIKPQIIEQTITADN